MTSTLFKLLSAIFFGMGQMSIWSGDDRSVPYLLSAIVLALTAMSFREQ